MMIIGYCAGERRIIRNGDGIQITEDGVVFANRHHWVHGVDGLPDPIIITVNVNAQEADFA